MVSTRADRFSNERSTRKSNRRLGGVGVNLRSCNGNRSSSRNNSVSLVSSSSTACRKRRRKQGGGGGGGTNTKSDFDTSDSERRITRSRANTNGKLRSDADSSKPITRSQARQEKKAKSYVQEDADVQEDAEAELQTRPPTKTFAFVDSNTKAIFTQITLKTENADLKNIFNEQNLRKRKKLAPLVLVERSTVNGRQKMRELGPDDETPRHANSAFYDDDFYNKKINPEPHKLESMDNPYVEPDDSALQATYDALSSLLGEDCECFESMKVAAEYYKYWRPENPKVILLAESHVSTPEELSCNGPIFDESLIDGYDGPTDFCYLVHCLAYGENEALKRRADSNVSLKKGDNSGTWQFWNLLAACVSSPDQDPLTYGKDIQKSSRQTVAERIQKKFEILKRLKELGIWLIDASIVGWYIRQERFYEIAKKSKKVTVLPSFRPHPKLKKACLAISFGGFVKNLIRKAVNDGELKLLIPIGKDVERALGHRLVDAVSVEGKNVKVVEAFPAPNARIDGGYAKKLKKIAEIVRNATSSSTDDFDHSIYSSDEQDFGEGEDYDSSSGDKLESGSGMDNVGGDDDDDGIKNTIISGGSSSSIGSESDTDSSSSSSLSSKSSEDEDDGESSVINPKKTQTWLDDKYVRDMPLTTTFTITPNVTCKAAVDLMKREGFDMVPVTENGSVIGVVSEGTISRQILSGRVTSEDISVEQAKVIDKTFRVIGLNNRLTELSRALYHEPYVLVVTEQRCFNVDEVQTQMVVSGIVTRRDLLNYVSKGGGGR